MKIDVLNLKKKLFKPFSYPSPSRNLFPCKLFDNARLLEIRSRNILEWDMDLYNKMIGSVNGNLYK